MRQTRIILPDYAEHFSCVGPACEDACCSVWSVAVDEAAYRKYRSLPAGPLRSLVDDAIRPVAAGKTDAAGFATIRMLPSGDCPFLTAERLCRIQVEQGESYLCQTCRTFPRTQHTIDGIKETALSLSCPEAARLVLLATRLLPPAAGPGYRITWDETETSQAPLRIYFWQIREFVVTLLQNRAYPLWQRLFLLGTFSRRLDELVKGEAKRSFPDLLIDFSRAVTARGLCATMETIPSDLRLQLEIVLRLINKGVHKVLPGDGLRQVISRFTDGIGHSPQASMESQVAKYADAYTRVYVPFFERHPYILENYLINAVLRDLYPFGAQLGDPEATPEPARAFAMLAVRFALIKGLLIGVAGARPDQLCPAEVVRTVQTVFKHFEHNKNFLSASYELLREKGLDNARGPTMLLRN